MFTKYLVVTMTASEKLIPGFAHVCQVRGMRSLKAVLFDTLFHIPVFYFFIYFFCYLLIQSWTVLQLNEFILHLSIIMVSSISDKPAPKPFVKKQTMISRFTCHSSSLVVSSR